MGIIHASQIIVKFAHEFHKIILHLQLRKNLTNPQINTPTFVYIYIYACKHYSLNTGHFIQNHESHIAHNSNTITATHCINRVIICIAFLGGRWHLHPILMTATAEKHSPCIVNQLLLLPTPMNLEVMIDASRHLIKPLIVIRGNQY